MNIQVMVKELHKLLREWERYADSPDTIGKFEWVKGVVYGMTVMLKKVKEHVSLKRGERL